MAHHKDSVSFKIFSFAAYFVVGLIIVLTVMVFIHIAAVAFSSPGPAEARLVGLYPKEFTLDLISRAFDDKNILQTFTNSLYRLVAGVIISVIMMLSVAYPLSKSKLRFPGRNVYAIFVLFTMLFSGGLIPQYLWIKQLNLLDTIWALVLPHSVNVFLCIVLMNFFKNIPDEIEDAATIDGASHIRTLFQIAVPLSKPALATVTLFAIIQHWNSWFDGLIYMRNPANYPYATYLRMLLIRMDMFSTGEDIDNIMRLGQRPLSMAYVMIAIIPIAAVYPFLQKYVKSGLLVGSVKG